MKKVYILPLLILIATIASLFYWFQLRPSNIRQECYAYTLKKREEKISTSYPLTNEEANNYFRRCLVEHGMKAEDIVK